MCKAWCYNRTLQYVSLNQVSLFYVNFSGRVLGSLSSLQSLSESLNSISLSEVSPSPPSMSWFSQFIQFYTQNPTLTHLHLRASHLPFLHLQDVISLKNDRMNGWFIHCTSIFPSFNRQPWSWGSRVKWCKWNADFTIYFIVWLFYGEEVFQGWFSFWFGWWTFDIWYLCLLRNYSGDKQIARRDRWFLVGQLQTHLKVKIHLPKLLFIQGFCSLFRSQFHGWNFLSRIRLQGVS